MGNLYERITTLCKDKGVSPSRMCQDLHISKSTMSEMNAGRRQGVSTATAQKIADYFGVSVGYLLGSETEKAPTSGERIADMSDVDVAFYGGYKELSEDDQKTIRDMVQLMRERRAARDK